MTFIDNFTGTRATQKKKNKRRTQQGAHMHCHTRSHTQLCAARWVQLGCPVGGFSSLIHVALELGLDF